MCFKKYNIIGVLILFFHFNGLSQDTLVYIFSDKVPIDEKRSLNLTHDIKQYGVNDSVFVLEGLFANPTLPEYKLKNDSSFELERVFAYPSPFEYQFIIKNNQWFMKYEADWKIFFNGKEDTFGSWIMDRVDVMIQWKKTNIVDLGDTIYMLIRTCDNPFIITQLGRDRKLVEEVEIDHRPLYFTYSSGFVAIDSHGGWLLIREDKEYLREYLEKKAYSER